ncbi:MAG: magnesium transporter, partial [Paracoccaceae bacterium]|nr:magnesium transporter [Paracoccaceae bacterium]
MSDQTDVIDAPEDETEDDYALRNEVVIAVLDAATAGHRDDLIGLLEPMHPADIADLLEQVGEDNRSLILGLAGDYIDGGILTEIDEDIRDEVIEALDPQVLAEAVRELESDDVVDLLEDLDEPQQAAIIEHLDMVDRIAVEQALSYPEFSAGRLMQREVVRAPEHWNVGDAIDSLRASEDHHLPEQFYHVILVDPKVH